MWKPISQWQNTSTNNFVVFILQKLLEYNIMQLYQTICTKSQFHSRLVYSVFFYNLYYSIVYTIYYQACLVKQKQDIKYIQWKQSSILSIFNVFKFF